MQSQKMILSGLRKELELELGKISKLRPFGETLHHGLENSRFDSVTGYAFIDINMIILII